MYNDKVIERFKNPKNVGKVVKASGIGTVGNAQCGDIMEISIKVEDNIITNAKFRTYGCTSAIASTDVAVDMIIGKSIEDALKVSNADVVKALGGLPAIKIHCSVLAQEAISAAVEDYRKKQEKLEKQKNK